MSNHIKQIRGQIRQIVKDLLPEILTNELLGHIAVQVNKKVSERLDIIDKKQKEINSYIVRNHASNEPLLKPKQ